MNQRQLEVQKASIQEEKWIIQQLQRAYKKASEDCQAKIEALAARQDLQNIQTIVYQQQYQKALKKQLDSIFDELHANSFQSTSDYLEKCYENGFFGTLYDLHGQGIPLIFPFDQRQVIQALVLDSKLSKPFYDRLGEDVSFLKKAVKAQVSRGIANGSSWFQVAQELANKMVSPFSTALYNSIRIARTEGHRIQNQAQWDTINKAKAKGADIVKQWDSTLDRKTRASHRRLDGQIRELNEPFEVDGHKAMYPGGFGIAKEDIHCRCVMLQRAKWALDEEELETLKERAAYFELDKTKDFEDFKNRFLHLPENADTMDIASGNWAGLNFPQNYKTKKEAIKALSDKYGISFSDSKKYPIDQDILCDAVSWMDAFEKEYPAFVKLNPEKLPKLVVKAPSGMKNTVGYFQYYWNGTPVEMALNGQYHANKKLFEEYVEKCIKNKWKVANATTRSTFVHEYGHYVSNSIRSVRGQRWEHDFIEACVTEYKKSHPNYTGSTYKLLHQVMGEVSRYGMTSESECFAETFAEYFGNDNPRDFAKIFGKKLDALLRNAQMSADGQRVLIPNP